METNTICNICIYILHTVLLFNTDTANPWLSGVKEGRKVKDNPKPWLKQKAVKTQYKMDLTYIFG
jgi:hypothetical protein